MKKGFTLIELIGAIVILSLVALLTFPVIENTIENNRIKIYDAQITRIETATCDWSLNNSLLLPTVEGQIVTITLSQLKKGGYLVLNIKNPITGILFPNDLQIEIKRENSNYICNVLEDTGTSGNTTIDEDSPSIILNGSYIQYFEVTTTVPTTYTDLGAIAIDSDSNDITSQLDSFITLDDDQVAVVEPYVLGNVYLVNYYLPDTGVSAIRTVIISDRTVPTISYPSTDTFTVTEMATFSSTTGVTVTDNSGEAGITLYTSGNPNNIPGRKIITYTATDASGNQAKVKRVITVVED